MNAYSELCSYDNFLLAFNRARKGKSSKPYVIEFQKDLKNNLLQLRSDLLFHSYRPESLKTFVIRDPKARVISKSSFRDRIVHHALCNIIQPIFEKRFIHDSYANQKGKGTLAAIDRFEHFKMKVSRNLSRLKDDRGVKGYILKADVRKFFDTVGHNVLLKIISKTIKDRKIMWLIELILSNHSSGENNKGMPLGNLTSQFFANVYLNELDQFAKHEMKAEYYIRYVDDFIIMHRSREVLKFCKAAIESFLATSLSLHLHPGKSRIFPVYNGTDFLGVKIFPFHKSIRKRNIRIFKGKLNSLHMKYSSGSIGYDNIYNCIEGWCAYSKNTDSYNLRGRIVSDFSERFSREVSSKEVNRMLRLSCS